MGERKHYQRTPVEEREREKISASYTSLYTYILFVVGAAAAFIGSSI
jgi:hypothetical protein